jgi:hypothetical protein
VDDLPPVIEENEEMADDVGAAAFTDDERVRLVSRS